MSRPKPKLPLSSEEAEKEKLLIDNLFGNEVKTENTPFGEAIHIGPPPEPIEIWDAYSKQFKDSLIESDYALTPKEQHEEELHEVDKYLPSKNPKQKAIPFKFQIKAS